jgi:hypothetical protein
MAGKGKRNLNAADLRAMNRSGLVTRRYPAGGGRAEVRIGNAKPSHPHAHTRRDEPSPRSTPPTG